MHRVELYDDIHGEILNVTINGVDIGPLVEADLDRRYPDRPKMRPTDPAGFREAWDVVERLWGETFGRARHAPWDSLDLPWEEMPDTPGVPRDRDARPSLDEVLQVRRDRMSTVRDVLDGLTEESLDGHTEPVEGPGWPEPRNYPVRQCLLVILNLEWEHRLYAERDLAVLDTRSG